MSRPAFFITALLCAVAAPLFAKGQDAKGKADELPPLVVSAPLVLTGIGYAPISTQPAKTDEGRRLLAIRASQLSAIRNLAEQIHGLNLQSASITSASAVQTDSIRASVSGTVKGARIVKITPKGDDTYETVVELDRAMMDARP